MYPRSGTIEIEMFSPASKSKPSGTKSSGTKSSGTKSSGTKPSGTRQIFNLIVLLLLIAVTAVRFLPSGRDDMEISKEEAAIMLTGFDQPKSKPLDPAPKTDLEPEAVESAKVPGKTILGEKNHARLTQALEALETRNQDYNELGLGPEEPGRQASGEAVPFAIVLPDPVTNSHSNPDQTAETVANPSAQSPDPVASAELPPPSSGDPPRVADIQPQGTGIWVREQRQGKNPIEIEDHASVNATQLADMAKVRNLSTDPRYQAPDFDISAVGSGRLGTYVIAEGRMVRLNGEIPAPNAPPEAWRLTKATATELHWMPVD